MSNEKYVRSEQLIAIYEQCNEHLREGDKKRDQILLFFSTLLGVLISNLDKMKFDFFTDLQNRILLIGVFGLFFIIGIILGRVLINYRLWHYRYVVAAQVVQILMVEGKEISKARINSLYKQVITTKYPNTHKKWIKEKGTEDMMLNIFIHVNFLSIIFFFGMILKNNITIMIVTIIGVYIIYIFSINKVNGILLNRLKETIKEQSDDEIVYVWTLNMIEDKTAKTDEKAA